MICDQTITAAFTGHRDYRGECDAQLRAAIRRLYADGYRTFLSGMAVGFDLAAAEAVIELRGELPGVRLVCVIPFAGQQRRFPQGDKERFERICGSADEVLTLSPSYDRMVYMRRNDFLVEHSSALVAWFCGREGGTEYTILKAVRAGLKIRNLYLDPQQTLKFEP